MRPGSTRPSVWPALALAAALFPLAPAATAQIVSYDFTTTASPTLTPNNGSFSASALASVPGGSVAGGAYTFSIPALNTGVASFTVTAAPGFQVTLTRFDFDINPSVAVLLGRSVSTPAGTSTDATLLSVGVQSLSFDHTDWVLAPGQTGTYSISVPAAVSLNPITLDNVRVYGSVQPVPEPGCVLLVSAAATAVGYARRRVGG